MITSRLKLVALAAALAAFALPASGASASGMVAPSAGASARPAVPSLHFPIDGTDPMTTGCAGSAVTVASKQINSGQGGVTVPVGDLQLRWSTGCGTNWGRFVAATVRGGPVDDVVSVWVDRQADNKYCGDQKGTGCNAIWWTTGSTVPSVYSNQLYGCGYATRAVVEIADYYSNGDPAYFYTPFVGGC